MKRLQEIRVTQGVINTCKDHGFGMFPYTRTDPRTNKQETVYVLKCTTCEQVIGKITVVKD